MKICLVHAFHYESFWNANFVMFLAFVLAIHVSSIQKIYAYDVITLNLHTPIHDNINYQLGKQISHCIQMHTSAYKCRCICVAVGVTLAYLLIHDSISEMHPWLKLNWFYEMVLYASLFKKSMPNYKITLTWWWSGHVKTYWWNFYCAHSPRHILAYRVLHLPTCCCTGLRILAVSSVNNLFI